MKKEFKIVLEDPWLGKRELGLGYLALIKDQLRLLLAFRDDGRTPSPRLLEDIQVYEYIIAHPQPEQAAEQYAVEMEKQRKKHGYGVAKMKVAKMLGWFQ